MPVYFAQSKPGAPIKIGFSKWPDIRVTQVICPLTRTEVRLLRVIDGDRSDERALLRRFADRSLPFTCEGRPRSKTGWGPPSEWFTPSPELLDLIASIQ